MLNFTFHNTTKILFGAGQIAEIHQEIPKNKRILITYGGGSVKQNGTLDEVKSALSAHTYFEFSGIEPNPSYETLMKAVAMVNAQHIDFLLAVGGGSVIDGTKFIAAAAKFSGDAWDILAKHAPLHEAIPLASVLTLPATGSEMNSNAVITRQATHEKLYFGHPQVQPVFSVLDPTKTYSLPPRQVANGVVDAFVHVMEQYMTYPADAPLQDRFAEAILLTLIEEGKKALQQPENYAVRANLMWCSTMALNGLIGAGVPQDWTTHMIGHEITALHGLDHAQTLAIILPSVLTVKQAEKREKLLQYAARIWGIHEGDEANRMQEAIEKTRDFFESLGVKIHLSDYGITQESIPKIINQLKSHGFVALGERQDIDLHVSQRILELSL
jgi:NADP-dependent alcohol dehydrogenase